MEFVVQEEGRFYVESSASSSLPHNPVPYIQPPSQPYLSTHLSRYITRRERHNIITIKYSSDVIILIAHHPHLDTNYIQYCGFPEPVPKSPLNNISRFAGSDKPLILCGSYLEALPSGRSVVRYR